MGRDPQKEVQSFFDLANYYRDHIPSFKAIAAPLSYLTKKGLPGSVRWEDAQEKPFVTLRKSLVNTPILCLPDHNKTFILRIDASNCGLGAALMQEHQGRFFPIEYRSKKLTSAERKYSTIEKKSLATVGEYRKFVCIWPVSHSFCRLAINPFTFLKDAKFRNDQIMR